MSHQGGDGLCFSFRHQGTPPNANQPGSGQRGHRREVEVCHIEFGLQTKQEDKKKSDNGDDDVGGGDGRVDDNDGDDGEHVPGFGVLCVTFTVLGLIKIYAPVTHINSCRTRQQGFSSRHVCWRFYIYLNRKSERRFRF